MKSGKLYLLVKIEIFEDIKNKIVEDTLLYIKTNTKDLDNQILFFLLSSIAMIFIFLVIIVMTSKVTKAIENLKII